MGAARCSVCLIYRIAVISLKVTEARHMQCELYEGTDELNTHSWYTAGIFVKNRRENKCLDKFWSWVEER